MYLQIVVDTPILIVPVSRFLRLDKAFSPLLILSMAFFTYSYSILPSHRSRLLLQRQPAAVREQPAVPSFSA